MIGLPIKSIMLTVAIALLAGGGALAATGGEIPIITDVLVSDDSVGDDAYPNHGAGVSAVARDKDAIGTWTNPAGKVIENHGQAVREAAHDKDKNKNKGDDASDDVSDDASEGAGPPEDDRNHGHAPEPGHGNGNTGQGNGNGNSGSSGGSGNGGGSANGNRGGR